MKLHLPKALLTAVLAVCVAPAVIAADVITLNGSNNGVDLNLTDVWGTNGTFVRAASGTAVTDTIGTLTAASGKSKFVIAGQWNDANSRFESLTIDKFVVGDGTGTVNLQIGTEQGTSKSTNTVVINEFEGKMDALRIDNGELVVGFDYSFSSAGQVTGAGTLVIGDGANVKVTLANNGDAAIQSNIRIDGGGTLTVSNKDGMGWGQGYACAPSVELKGTSAEKTANLVLSATQTLGTNITMSGFATISGAAEAINPRLDNGITISVSGTENLISAGFYMRSSAILDVAKDAELDVTGKVSFHSDGDKPAGPSGYDTGSLIKKGEGKVTFSNASNVFEKKYYNEAGETVIDAAAQFKNGIKVSGGEFTLNADITLGSGENIELAGGTLNLNNTNAAQILTGTTGSGNITIGTDITLGNNTATQVTGGLTIESGKTLQVGNGTGHSSTIASFSSVKLDGGTLKFHNNGSTVHNLTVSKESTLRVQDMNAAGSIILLDDTTTLDAKLNVTSGFKGTLQIAKLTGTGDLDIKADNNEYNDTLRVNIDALDSYTGKISYTASAWGSGPKTHNVLTIKSDKDVALAGLQVLAGKSGDKYTVASAIIENKANMSLGAVELTHGSTLSISNLNGSENVTLNSVTMSSLTGNGVVSFTNADTAGKLVISSLQGYTGSLTVTKGTGATSLEATANGDNNGLVNLKGVTLSNGAKGWIKVKNTDTSNTSSLGAVSLSGGSDLRIWNVAKTGTTNISSLTVSGSATLGTYRDGSSFQGTVNIASLSSQGESAELTLKNASQTDDATVINLNGGTFTGTIKLESDSHRGSGQDNRSRDLQVNLKNVDVAAGSIIAFQNPSTADTVTHDGSNYITLGVGVEGAKVAGLTGTTTNAATIKATEGTKSLEIITAKDANYSTNAKVESSVNLVKSGAGKQTISGAVSTTGSVKVNAGELALTGTSALSLNQLSLFDTTNATGGTLSVGSANGGTVSIVSAGSVVVGKGSVLNGNLTLGAGTALTLNGYGDNAATINGTLTLGTGMQVSGLEQLLNDLAAQEAGADGLKSLKLFNVTTVNFGTVEATLAMAADALVEEQPLIAGYDAANYFSTLSVGEYALVFQNSALYIQATAPIPEPTTATLSLLALTALAARRRRK